MSKKRPVIWGLLASGTVLGLASIWVFSPAHSPKQSKHLDDMAGMVQEPGITSQRSEANRPESLIGSDEPSTDKLFAGLEASEDPDQLSDLVDRAVQSIPDSKLKTTLDALAGRHSTGANLLRETLVRRWAESNPRNAAQWVSQLEDGVEYRSAVSQVAIAWAGADPQGAWGWVVSLPESPVKTEALLDIGYEVAASQPGISIGIASILSSGQDRDNLIVHVVRQWTSSDPETATGWVQAVADTALRQRLLAAVAENLAENDPVAAGFFVSNNLIPGSESDRSIVEIVQRWAENSPNGAAAWVAAFPDTPLRQTAMENLIMVWSAQDNGSAARWVQGLPPGSLRDTGLIALAECNSSPLR